MTASSRFERLILLAIAVPVAAAALCPSNLEVEATDTSLRLSFQTDTPGSGTQARLQYGRSAKMERRSLSKVSHHPTARGRFLKVADLLPGLEKLYFDAQVSSPDAKEWSRYGSCQAQLCPSEGAQPGGYTCEVDGSGGLVPAVAVPEDSGKLDLPRLPRHARPNPRKRPAIDGEVTQLADCKAVQQALNDHGAGGTKDLGRNHEIRMPPGQICRPELEDSEAGKNLASYTLPPKTGAGETIVTCGWDPNMGPPPGVQYTTKFRSEHSCGFGINRETVRPGAAFEINGSLFNSAGDCGSPPCTQGWRFETLVIETGSWRDFPSRKVAVESVDTATGRVRLAEPIDSLYAGNAEAIFNLPGIQTMEFTRGQGVFADVQQRGCLVSVLSSNELRCYGYDRMIGEYAGGGYVSAAQGYEIESCMSRNGATTCELKADHGLGNFYSFPIAGLSGGSLEVSAEAHGWNDQATVLIEGNSACDGIYVVQATPAANSAKLARTACSGTGGVARRLYTGRFLDLEGDGAERLEGARLVDFPGPRSVRAFDADLGGAAIASGGFVYTNPKVARFFKLPLASRMTWDRILFDLEPPFRMVQAIEFVSNADGSFVCDCAIVDSFVDNLHFWQPISPRAGVVESAQTYAPFSSVSTFAGAHVVKDLQVDGVTFQDSVAFAYFADQFGGPGPQDVTFRRLSIAIPNALVAGPNSKGLAYNLRHFIELKAGMRVLVEGVQVQAWPAVGVAFAAPIYFSYRTTETEEPRYMQDLTVRNIFMRSVAAGMGFIDTGTEGYSPQATMRRILVDNWLLDGIDYPNRQAAPHDQALQVPGTFFETPLAGGVALFYGGPMEDVKVSRVTARRLRSKLFPNFLLLSGDRGNGIQVDRSIISFSPSSGELDGVAPYRHQTRELFPPVTEGGATGFLGWTGWMGEPDPRSWFGTSAAPVGVIPCLSDSSTARFDYTQPNNAKSAAERAFGCAGKDCERWNVLIAGKDRQSCEEREKQVLGRDLEGIGQFEGLGADTKELANALGFVPSQVDNIDSTGATLIYAPVSKEACIVDHGRDPDFKVYIRGQDTGAEGNRAMRMGGYTPGETAYYRLLCPRSMQVWGKFETTP